MQLTSSFLRLNLLKINTITLLWIWSKKRNETRKGNNFAISANKKIAMENLDTRFEILFRFMPMMDPQILHKTGHFTPILQECLTLPGSKEILASFGIDKLLAIRATTRISITGTDRQFLEHSSNI